VLDRERLCWSTEVCSAQLDVTVTPVQHVTITPVRHLRLIRVTVVIDDVIDDVNDNVPAFPVSSVTVSVYEMAPPGSRFPLPVATEADCDNAFHFRLLWTPTLGEIECATTFWESRATSGWRRQVAIRRLTCSWC